MAGDDEAVTEDDAVVKTANGERYEALTVDKSGETDDET
jgi:hypothetical protein